MTVVRPSVVVPAIPPQPPQLSLLRSAVRPGNGSDPADPIFHLGDRQLDELLPSDLRAELAGRSGEAWTRGFAYAPENHYGGVLRDACDGTTVDVSQLPAPTGLATQPSIIGGTLAAATYTYEITAVNANGQTTPGTPQTAVVASGTTGSVKLTWNKEGAATTYNVYGRVGGSLGLIATVTFDDDQAAQYTDTGTPAPGAIPPVSNTTGGPGSYTNLPMITVTPYAVVVEDTCSTFGFEDRDFKGRALRLLENATPAAIGHEFWAGTLAQAKGYTNRYLADANVVDVTPGGGPPSINRGLQLLQDALSACGFGGQGMIHVQPQTAPDMLRVRRVGHLLLDLFDNIVVVDPGYPGTGPANNIPAAGTSWMFASDLAMVRTEDVGQVYPDTLAEATDRGQNGQPNSITFRAEKFAAAYADFACQFAVRVTLST